MTPLRPLPRSTDPADYQRVPRPVAAMAKDFAAGHHIEPHRHERAQLIFAAHGAMLVSTGEGSWAVPPQRAVWMPAGTTHEIRMAGDVAMRTLYLRDDAAARLTPRVRVLAVSPLLRELILRACALPLDYDEAGPAGRLMTLILDEIAALPTVALDLPLPRDARLGRICRALSAEPGTTRSLSEWGRDVGASPRTLARLFVKETGLTFAAWRQQARLLAATAMLAAGEPITRIALELGYESPSAFTAMFKRALGAPPSHYFGAEAPAASPVGDGASSLPRARGAAAGRFPPPLDGQAGAGHPRHSRTDPGPIPGRRRASARTVSRPRAASLERATWPRAAERRSGAGARTTGRSP